MLQRGYLNFIGIHNEIRTRNKDEDVETVLKSRFILNNNQTTAAEAVHIYEEKAAVKIYSQLMLTTLVTPLIVIKALDKLPGKFL